MRGPQRSSAGGGIGITGGFEEEKGNRQKTKGIGVGKEYGNEWEEIHAAYRERQQKKLHRASELLRGATAMVAAHSNTTTTTTTTKKKKKKGTHVRNIAATTTTAEEDFIKLDSDASDNTSEEAAAERRERCLLDIDGAEDAADEEEEDEEEDFEKGGSESSEETREERKYGGGKYNSDRCGKGIRGKDDERDNDEDKQKVNFSDDNEDDDDDDDVDDDEEDDNEEDEEEEECHNRENEKDIKSFKQDEEEEEEGESWGESRTSWGKAAKNYYGSSDDDEGPSSDGDEGADGGGEEEDEKEEKMRLRASEAEQVELEETENLDEEDFFFSMQQQQKQKQKQQQKGPSTLSKQKYGSSARTASEARREGVSTTWETATGEGRREANGVSTTNDIRSKCIIGASIGGKQQHLGKKASQQIRHGQAQGEKKEKQQQKQDAFDVPQEEDIEASAEASKIDAILRSLGRRPTAAERQLRQYCIQQQQLKEQQQELLSRVTTSSSSSSCSSADPSPSSATSNNVAALLSSKKEEDPAAETANEEDKGTKPSLLFLLEQLPEEERQTFINKEHPELQRLLSQLRLHLQEARQSLAPLLLKARNRRDLVTSEGLSYLDMKNQVVLAYLTYLSYYVLLKTHSIPIEDHPVVERLVEARLLLEKLRFVDQRLQPQINQLLSEAAEEAGPQKRNSSNNDSSSSNSSSGVGEGVMRPRPEMLLAVGEEEEDEDEGQSDVSEEQRITGKQQGRASSGEVDAASTEKKKDAAMREDEDEEGEEPGQQQQQGVYRPPKLFPMEFTGDWKATGKDKAERELRRAAARLRNSELVRAVREQVEDIPEERGIQQWLEVQHIRKNAAAALARQKAREKYEEEHLMRLATSRRDKKEQQLARQLEQQQRRMAVGTTLGELTAFTESALSVVGGAGDDDDDPTLMKYSKKAGKTAGATTRVSPLSAYLNAAKQVAEASKKAAEFEQADRAIFSKQQQRWAALQQQQQQQQQREQKRQMKGKTTKTGDEDLLEAAEAVRARARERRSAEERGAHGSDGGSEDGGNTAWEELLQLQQKRKDLKKQRMQEKARLFVPQLPDEVEGPRATTRQILKNKGLTRKRKKFEGNARVHNRMKFERKMKKLKTIRPHMRPVVGNTYMGEESGIRPNVKKSLNLS